MNNLPPHFECCDDLASYIERASCAVAVLGDLLENVPEEAFNGAGAGQSVGFLLQILGAGMMQRSLDGYAFITQQRDAISKETAVQTVEEKPA